MLSSGYRPDVAFTTADMTGFTIFRSYHVATKRDDEIGRAEAVKPRTRLNAGRSRVIARIAIIDIRCG